MRFSTLTVSLAAILLSTAATAQVQTLTQSTNNTTVTVGASIACATVPPAAVFTVDNGYFRSYPLSTVLANIDILSITFGVENVASTSPAGFPMVIRLFNDPSAGAPAPYAGLVLRHTENFTLPVTTTPTIVTQALTGPIVTFLTTETLVVEVFSPSGLVGGNRFYIGSNALGQSAPGYLRAPACGAATTEPANLATIGFPNMHMIIDVNYVFSGSGGVTFPGTNEDFTLFTAVNTNPLTTGIGNSVKTVTGGDNLTAKVVSTGGTFNFRELVVVGQGYPTGIYPFPPVAPGIHESFPGLLLLIGGVPPGPFGPVLLPPGGMTLVFTVPPGLAGSSALLQGVVITWFAPFAVNGLYATTDSHEIDVI